MSLVEKKNDGIVSELFSFFFFDITYLATGNCH